jgi:hypothetical protein
MDKVSYRVEELRPERGRLEAEALEAYLNDAAQEGWRLDQLLPLSKGRLLAILRQPARGRRKPRRPAWP